MSPVEEFMNVFADTAEKNCSLDSIISLEELAKEGGLYAEAGEGFAQSKYFDKSEIKEIPILLLCRNKEQSRCMEQLEAICNYFQRLKEYPSGEMFNWLNAEITKNPSKIGRDEDGVYHYSAILSCKLFY